MLATAAKVVVATLDALTSLLKKLVGYALLFVVAILLIAVGFTTLIYHLATG